MTSLAGWKTSFIIEPDSPFAPQFVVRPHHPNEWFSEKWMYQNHEPQTQPPRKAAFTYSRGLDP